MCLIRQWSYYLRRGKKRLNLQQLTTAANLSSSLRKLGRLQTFRDIKIKQGSWQHLPISYKHLEKGARRKETRRGPTGKVMGNAA